jgi:hypothetical protein
MKPCLAHFSTKWIRLAVKKCRQAERKAVSMPVDAALAQKPALGLWRRGCDPAGALGKAFNFIDFGESMSIVRHAL